MLSAFVTATTGVILCYFTGVKWWGLEFTEVIRAILATDIAGLVAVFTTVNLQYVKRLSFIVKGTLRTWSFFLTLYVFFTVWLGPKNFTAITYLVLSIPLIMTTGFSIMVFGKIQDAITKYRQGTLRAKVSR